MTETTTFIEYLKFEQPRLWEAINGAADDGLIIIDEENDAVSATNRLLLTYPELHSVLNLLVDNWVRKKTETLTRAASGFLSLQGKDYGG